MHNPLRRNYDTVDVYFRDRLEELLRERGLDPKDLEDMNVISATQVKKYLDRENIPNLRTACRLAEFFDVSLDWLCGIDDDAALSKAKEVYSAFDMTPPWKR